MTEDQVKFGETGPFPGGQARHPYRLLAVDDSEDDLFVLQWALKKGASTRFQLVGCLTNGAEALRYFRGDGPYADRVRFPLPDVVLLDLKMPEVDGFEVLEWLNRHRPQRNFAVVVVTSSPAPADMQRAKALGAEAFETKPNGQDGYIETLRRIEGRLVAPHVERAPANGQRAQL